MSPSEFKILIIDEAHEVLLDLLKDFDVMYRPNISPEEILQILPEFHGLVMRSKVNLDASYLKAGKNLRIIGRLGSGMDNIDEALAKEKGIICCNAPEGNRDAVAEQTIGSMLSLLANIPQAQHELRKGIWDRKSNSGVELSGLTVGIIGYGNVGQSVARRLRVFGCKILAYDLYKGGFGDEQVQECSLEEVKNKADIITLHVPLNEASQAMINKQFIASLEKDIYLLNLSRGKVLINRDLIEGLRSGKIKGAALDVLANEGLESYNQQEKDEFEFLANHPAVILTPHIGGLTRDSFRKLSEVLGARMAKKNQ